jgi:CBS domain-containing protein
MRQGLEKLKRSGYSAIPVIDTEDRYVGVVSEGDFLWNILANNESLNSISMKNTEKLTVRDIIQNGKIKAVCIDTDMEQLLEQAKNQNLVPVIDDRSIFIGIITRRDIITYFMKKL